MKTHAGGAPCQGPAAPCIGFTPASGEFPVAFRRNQRGTNLQNPQPPSNAVGGYTNPTGSAPPDTTGGCIVLIQGQSGSQGQNGACNVSPVNMEQQSFTFYWLAGGGIQMTYYYTMTNGQSASSTATFNIDAPSGVSVTAQVGQATMLLHGGLPTLWFVGVPGPDVLGSSVGVLFSASGTPPEGNVGAYSWVQLIHDDTVHASDAQARGACPGGVPSGSTALDTVYPYGVTTTSATATTPNDMAADSPWFQAGPNWGEVARSFGATMYLMWVPQADSRCGGSGCTIPVPLGSVSTTSNGWVFQGDAINTLSVTRGINGTPWMMNFNGQPPEPAFQADHVLPTWTSYASYGGNFWQCP